MFSLLANTMRRAWMVGMLASVGLAGFFVIACRMFQRVQERGDSILFSRMMPKWLQSAFNINPANLADLNGFLCICFQHPVVLVILLGMPIALITAFFTGDIEKRTLALVLARPVRRSTITLAIALVIFFWVGVGLASVLAGCYIGASWTGQAETLNAAGIERATVALAFLVFAFTGIIAGLSAMMNVRGDAVGWALTLVVVMYVWNFLAQVWSGARDMANYSLFHYYRPTEIILGGALNVTHLQVLGVVGVVGWVVALLAFRLRSFPL